MIIRVMQFDTKKILLKKLLVFMAKKKKTTVKSKAKKMFIKIFNQNIFVFFFTH